MSDTLHSIQLYPFFHKKQQHTPSRTDRRSCHIVDRWDFIFVAACTITITIRWNQSRAILQRWQSPSRLWHKLYVYTQNRYTTQCNRRNCIGRRRYLSTEILFMQSRNNAFIVLHFFTSFNSVLYYLVQQPNLSHPFHLHGFSYSVIGM